jgi:hypothetical protein
MRFLKAFGGFWYDFLVGDDWKVAVAVVLALGVPLAALELHLFGDGWVAVLGGLAVMAFFSVGLAVDVRVRRRKPAAVAPPVPPR